MSLKILGGRYKGLSVNPGKGFTDRPTSVILRRKLFDANQEMSSINFVDLCAGTGMMGLEANSRGANKIYFVDRSKSYINALSKVINDKNIEGDFELKTDDCVRFIKRLSEQYHTFEDWIFFLDPPYENLEIYSKCFETLAELKGSFQIWLEGCEQKNFTISELAHRFGSYVKIYRQGTNYIAVYQF